MVSCRIVGLLWMAAALGVAQRPALVENEQVRVLDVTSPPHQKGRMHEHAVNRVMVYLTRGANRIAYEDGRVREIKFQAGDALWDAAGGRHTSENPGDAPFRVIEIELKTPGRPHELPQLDPVRVAPGSYKVLIDNPQTRVLRVRFDARQKIPLHEHTLNRVVVYLHDQRARVTSDTGEVTESSAKAGEVRFAGPARHREENLGSQPFEVIVVELK
jgi:quercetin dioxygenase-like cupin family protein